ncbi:hypothetical protein D3C86_1617100 [compost metagenome]
MLQAWWREVQCPIPSILVKVLLGFLFGPLVDVGFVHSVSLLIEPWRPNLYLALLTGPLLHFVIAGSKKLLIRHRNLIESGVAVLAVNEAEEPDPVVNPGVNGFIIRHGMYVFSDKLEYVVQFFIAFDAQYLRGNH